jgi:hypothetical protein
MLEFLEPSAWSRALFVVAGFGEVSAYFCFGGFVEAGPNCCCCCAHFLDWVYGDDDDEREEEREVYEDEEQRGLLRWEAQRLLTASRSLLNLWS